MSRYLKFIHNVKHILKVCILPNMTMLGLIPMTDVASAGATHRRRSAEGLLA